MRYYHYGTKRHENLLKGSGMPLSQQADAFCRGDRDLMRLTENVLVVVRKGSEQVNGSELYNEKGQFSIMGTECALRTLYVTAKKADIG